MKSGKLPLADSTPAAGSAPADPSLGPKAKKARKVVDVMDARNALYASQDKDVKSLIRSAIEATKKAIESFQAGSSKAADDICMENYLQVAMLRRIFLRLWHLPVQAAPLVRADAALDQA